MPRDTITIVTLCIFIAAFTKYCLIILLLMYKYNDKLVIKTYKFVIVFVDQ